MADNPTKKEFEQKVKELEDELVKSEQEKEALRISQKEELLAGRVEKSAIRRIQINFAIIGVLFAILAVLGLSQFAKNLERSLSDSISRDVKQKVTLELSKMETFLKDIESKVEDARKKAEKTMLETDVRMENTVEQVSQIGRLMVDDVGKHRREILSELREEAKKFAEERKETREESNRILNKIKTELENLERLTTVVRAPLRDKIKIVKTLGLDMSASDADIQRYLAILVLKEMEDAELVRRENVQEEARQTILQLFEKDGLHDEFFAEVRFRIVRVVGELGLVVIACQQVLDPSSWERDNLIFLLGALGDPKTIPTLARIVKKRKEPVKLRESAIRSLAAIGGASFLTTESGYKALGVKVASIHAYKWPGPETITVPGWGGVSWPGIFEACRPRDPDIEAMRPRSLRGSMYFARLTDEQFRLAVDTVSSVLSDSREPTSLRKLALRTLRQFRDPKVIEIVKELLFNEWEEYGEEAIDLLGVFLRKESVLALRDFALTAKGEKPLRLRCIQVLSRIVLSSTVTALTEISDRTEDNEISAAAHDAAQKVAKQLTKVSQ